MVPELLTPLAQTPAIELRQVSKFLFTATTSL